MLNLEVFAWHQTDRQQCRVPPLLHRMPNTDTQCVLCALCLCRPTDVQRVAELVQDPRPVEEKQQVVLQVRVFLLRVLAVCSGALTSWPHAACSACGSCRQLLLAAGQQHSVVHLVHLVSHNLQHWHPVVVGVFFLLLQEVEDTLVSFLERGATVETDILTNLKLLLPPDVTKQLDEFIPPPPNAQPSQQWDEEVVSNQPPVIYTADSVLENQIGEQIGAVVQGCSSWNAALLCQASHTCHLRIQQVFLFNVVTPSCEC